MAWKIFSKFSTYFLYCRDLSREALAKWEATPLFFILIF